MTVIERLRDKANSLPMTPGVYIMKNADGEIVYDEFNPGAGVYTKRVMATEYDLSEYLVDGENVILAVVAPGWWRGTIFYDTYGLGLGMAFCAELDVDGEKIVTDDSWQTMWGGRVRAADFYHGELYNASFDSYEDMSYVEGLDDLIAPNLGACPLACAVSCE